MNFVASSIELTVEGSRSLILQVSPSPVVRSGMVRTMSSFPYFTRKLNIGEVQRGGRTKLFSIYTLYYVYFGDTLTHTGLEFTLWPRVALNK